MVSPASGLMTSAFSSSSLMRFDLFPDNALGTLDPFLGGKPVTA